VGSVFDSVTLVQRPPDGVIDSPVSDMTVAQGTSLHWAGTAIENDGDGDAAFFHWNFDGGAVNSTVEDPGLIRFDVPGTYHVTFTVRDSDGYQDPTPPTRTIVVQPTSANRTPVAVFDLSPRTGNAPLVTTADGSFSSDADGSVTSYAFNFGDGQSTGPGSIAVQTHTYVAGTYTAQLTVKDDRGASAVASVPVIVAPVQNGPNLAGNPSVETNLAGWVAYTDGATLTRTPGGFDQSWTMQSQGPPSSITSFGVNDSPNWIAQTTAPGITYRFSAWVRSSSAHGSVRIRVREFLGGVNVGTQALSAPVALSTTWKLVTLDYVTARAGASLDFQVLDFPVVPLETFQVDNVTIKTQGPTTGVETAAPLELAAQLQPNPLRQREGEIQLTLPRASTVRIQIIDLSGRLVRTVMNQAAVAAGAHTVRFEAVDSQGGALRAGLYFMRFDTASGTRVQRFAVLR